MSSDASNTVEWGIDRPYEDSINTILAKRLYRVPGTALIMCAYCEPNPFRRFHYSHITRGFALNEDARRVLESSVNKFEITTDPILKEPYPYSWEIAQDRAGTERAI